MRLIATAATLALCLLVSSCAIPTIDMTLHVTPSHPLNLLTVTMPKPLMLSPSRPPAPPPGPPPEPVIGPPASY